MFRKIVSNLNFSPALVGQLGFYAKRLRKEEATRKLGLIFTALALVVQSFAIFSPPEAANAATPGQVNSSPRCKVNVVGPRGNAFSVSNKVATVSFDITGGKSCKVRISANSYFAPSMNGKPWSKQTLHDRNTRIFDTPGRYTMRTTLPAQSNKARGCFYQVDLTYGTHNVLPVLAYGHGKLNCGPVVKASAICSGLSIIRSSAGKYTFTGRAAVRSAKISKYTFAITTPTAQTTNVVRATSATSASVNYAATKSGKYVVKLTVTTSLGQKSAAACNGSFTIPGEVTPVANCVAVNATIANRTQAYFTGSAAVSGGARISNYTFIVKNAAGAEVSRTNVASTTTSAASSAVSVPRAGNYTVQLVVQTSLGDKTNTTSCVKPFTIAPPEVCQYNPTLPPNSPDCQPCPDNPAIWIKDKDCKAVIISTKTSTNMTQGNVEASKVMAKAGDKLTYTISVQNKGYAPETITLQEELEDVLEYATLVDQGGGTFNSQNKILTWPAVSVAAGQKQSRTIVVQVLDKVPATNTGTGVPTSYDCKMTNEFGNTIDVNMDCPPEKVVVEQVVKELPQTGPRENMIFAAVVFSVVAYFYARSRQLGREVRLVRRSFNAGTI